jgi:uncharacterized protein
VSLRRLNAVEEFERHRCSLGFSQCRVRHHGEVARVEVLPDQLERAASPEVREALVRGFRRLGFHYVTLDLQGYRSGSLNEMLADHGGVPARVPLPVFVTTADGGRTWSSSSLTPSDDVEDFACSSAASCLLMGRQASTSAGSATESDFVRATSNGGQSWTNGSLPQGFTLGPSSALSCADPAVDNFEHHAEGKGVETRDPADLSPVKWGLRIDVFIGVPADIYVVETAEVIFGDKTADNAVATHVVRRWAEHRCAIRAFGCCEHLTRLSSVHGHASLTEDVFASVKSREGNSTVHVRGSTNEDGVDAFPRDEVFPAVEDTLDTMFLGGAERAFTGAVRDCCENDVFFVAQAGNMAGANDAACSDDADANRPLNHDMPLL